MKTIAKIVVVAILCVSCLVLIPVGCACNWLGRYASDAAETTYNETKASTLLQKYTWFKDTSASLDAKTADIGIYESKFQSLMDQYKDPNGVAIARAKWARTDLETWNQWAQEVAGIKASFNSLAGEYNAAMSKVQFRFCNVGDLPAGADKPLPRTYKPYVSQ